MGNEAIGRGIVECGCSVATSYPGTPASEILEAVVAFTRETGHPMHVEWSVNEKVAYEVALAASYTGKRAAVSMKQVGLNVASDPFMSSAYMGVKGGFIVISADDPGPHSSQTEQDSRMLAMMAKIPVLDPDSPRQAKEMIATAYALSEEFKTPVMLRPTTRVCHSRQDLELLPVAAGGTEAKFEKDPARWAATRSMRPCPARSCRLTSKRANRSRSARCCGGLPARGAAKFSSPRLGRLLAGAGSETGTGASVAEGAPRGVAAEGVLGSWSDIGLIVSGAGRCGQHATPAQAE